jgi:hypothetical protein
MCTFGAALRSLASEIWGERLLRSRPRTRDRETEGGLEIGKRVGTGNALRIFIDTLEKLRTLPPMLSIHHFGYET